MMTFKPCPKCRSAVSATVNADCVTLYCSKHCGWQVVRPVGLPKEELIAAGDKAKISWDREIKTIVCLCHTILGGKPCGKTYKTTATNCTYHPECKPRVSKIKQKLARIRIKEKGARSAPTAYGYEGW